MVRSNVKGPTPSPSHHLQSILKKPTHTLERGTPNLWMKEVQMFRLTCAHSLYSLASCLRQVGEGWDVHDNVCIYIYVTICRYIYIYIQYILMHAVLIYMCTSTFSCILLFVDSFIHACILAHPFIRSFASTFIRSLKRVWISYTSTSPVSFLPTIDLNGHLVKQPQIIACIKMKYEDVGASDFVEYKYQWKRGYHLPIT